jgi:hypothetical protein
MFFKCTARRLKTDWLKCCCQYVIPFYYLDGPNTNRLVSSDVIQFISNCTNSLLPIASPNMTEYICLAHSTLFFPFWIYKMGYERNRWN